MESTLLDRRSGEDRPGGGGAGRKKPRIAIVGSGAAGLSAAFHLRHSCALTLFEKDAGFGGHAHTFVVPDGPDAGLPLDVGFMVMSEARYPRMSQMLGQLAGVGFGPSEMSFSYACRVTGQEYAINRDGAGGAPTFPPVLASLIGEILRFCRHATQAVAENGLGRRTLAEYLVEFGASDALRDRYVLPMGAALWSAPPGQILRFPADLYLRFFDNHGLLTPAAGLTWQHVRGGAQVYVQAVLAALPDAVLRNATRVERITRDAEGVTLQVAGSAQPGRFDAVVIATHADQALALLADADPEERALLGPFRYQPNQGVLHWDADVMPRDPSAWASWNYERESADSEAPLSVSYHLNRLQDHRGSTWPYFVTLNRQAPIDPAKTLARFSFEHPVFDLDALDAQHALAGRGLRRRTCFAGSYFSRGFHEDAIASGHAAAQAVGALVPNGIRP